MIVVLNGSPRSDSKTLNLTKYLLDDITLETTIINAYDLNISSCDDCRYCITKRGCKFSDNMDMVMDTLHKATTLIISTPVYFGAPTDKLMKILNRFQTWYNAKNERNDSEVVPKIHTSILVSTAGSSEPTMFNGLIETQKIINRLFSVEQTKLLLVKNAEENDPLKNPIILKTAKKIGQIIKENS